MFIPAKAGTRIQWTTKLLIMNVCLLDSRIRGNDERGAIYDVTYKSLVSGSPDRGCVVLWSGAFDLSGPFGFS